MLNVTRGIQITDLSESLHLVIHTMAEPKQKLQTKIDLYRSFISSE